MNETTAVLGEFDGLHIGHRTLVAEACRHAALRGRPAVAVVLDRGNGAPALTTPVRRCELLLGAGVDMAVVVDVSTTASDVTALARKIRETLGADVAFVACPPEASRGPRWPALRPALAQAGIDVVELARHRDAAGRPVTAALISEQLSAGNVAEVTTLLGRPHQLSGVVEIGDQRGRTIGFPTANIPLDHSQVWPGLGVYAARVRVDGDHYDAAVNIGVRPTIYGADGAPVLEAHLLDFEGDLYGHVIDVALVDRLREERQFDSLDALVQQLHNDIATTRRVLAPPGR